LGNNNGSGNGRKGDMALAGALEMAGYGFRVFPLRPTTRTPWFAQWQRAASDDVDEIKAWAEQYPGCIWGVFLDEHAVLDVDHHTDDVDGAIALDELERSHGRLTTWLVHTPRDGRHYYYSRPSSEPVKSVKNDSIGLELRAKGLYVVAPGGHANGGVYRWDDELHPHKVARAILPDFVPAFVANGKPNGAASASIAEKKNPAKTTLDEWLETKVREPGRNNALARGVGIMAARGIPKAVAEIAATQWCQTMAEPPFTEQEMKECSATFESVYKAEALKQITADEDTVTGVVLDHFEDFIKLEIPPAELVLDPILPTQGLGIVYGYRGVGKTYATLGMGHAIAGGSAFLKWKAPKARRVLYIDGEVAPDEMKARLNRLAVNGLPPTEYLTFMSMMRQDRDVTYNLAEELDQAVIEKIAADYEVLFLDNRSTLVYAGRENEAESWDVMQRWLLRLRRAGKTVWLTDHASKSGANRGTSKREDIFNTVIHLKYPDDYEHQQGARFEVHFTKHRGFHGEDAESFEAQMTTDEAGADIWTVKSLADTRADAVAELLKEGRSVPEIAKELSIGKSTVSRIRMHLRVIEGGKKEDK
jgi:AAA domain/Bifunctional DNA primase/polymerase, N-terminal